MLDKQKVTIAVAEAFGVMILVTAVYAMVARTSFPLFAAIAAGLTVGGLVLSIGPKTGAHVNPAITLGLWSIKKISTARAVMYVVAQVLGGVAALYLIKYLVGQPIENIAGKFEWKVLLSEAIGALVFGFGVANAVYRKFEGGKLAFAVGGSLTVGIVVASLASNAILNPAVAIGLNSFNWAYAAGPVIGSIVGMNMYMLLFTDVAVPKAKAVKNKK